MWVYSTKSGELFSSFHIVKEEPFLEGLAVMAHLEEIEEGGFVDGKWMISIASIPLLFTN